MRLAPAGRRGAGQSVQLGRACPAGRAGGRGPRMLYLIAEQLGFPGILNLIRYISFRAGAASATALADRPAARPQVHQLAARDQGKGQPIRDRRAPEPSRQARHPDDGRPAHPDLGLDLGPAVDGADQPVRLGMPGGDRRLRADRLARRLRQGQESAPCGALGQDAARTRIPHRRLRDLADGAHRQFRSLSALHQGDRCSTSAGSTSPSAHS